MTESSTLFWYTCWIGLLLVGFVKGKTCWDTTWYNSSSPGDHGGSDFEAVNKTVLNTICPDGVPVVAAHCKDEKGEPFTGFKNDTGNHYTANCTTENGLQCYPYNGTIGASCADFAIQYGCNCPTTTTAQLSTPEMAMSHSSRHVAAREETTTARNKNSANTVGVLGTDCKNSVILTIAFAIFVMLTSLAQFV